MKKQLQKIKDLFKKRVVILGTVFAFLLFCWYMTVPIKIKNCDIGNICYAHKFFNMCSDKIININGYYLYDYNGYEMNYQQDKNKTFTRDNIQGHISSNRMLSTSNVFKFPPYLDYAYYLEDDMYFYIPDTHWINRLIIIGHYDEAIRYIQSFPTYQNINFSALNTHINEGCHYFEILGDVRRIGILGCKIASPIITLFKEKVALQNENQIKDIKDSLVKNVNDARNDIIKIRTHEKMVRIANEAIDKGQYNSAYEAISEYALKQNNANLLYNSHNFYLIRLYLKLGIAYMDKQDYRKAIKCFENILKIQDYNYKAHEKLEICYRKLGNTQKAEEHTRIMKELLAL